MDWSGVKAEEAALVLSLEPFRGWLEEIVRRSDMDVAWALQELSEKRMQAWVFGKGVPELLMLTQVHRRPKTKVLVVWGIAGKRLTRMLPQIWETVGEWARQQGCTMVECTGRLGLERVLGWRRRAVVLTKEL